MYALTNSSLYTGTRILQQHALLIQENRIVEIMATANLPTDCPQVDLQGLNISPGFIDLQLNGCGGVMFNDAIAASTLDIMHQTNRRSGTTSFLPTLITAPDVDMEAAMEVVQRYRRDHPHSVLGLHLEGPYLNPKRKGIHNGAYVRLPERSMLAAIAAAGPEVVRLVTLAPEQVTATEIRMLVEAGITVSAGHTNATYEEATGGFAAGVTMATHLFNAMSPWQSRSPGMVGAVLSHPQVYAGIIADGHHVHYTSIALAKQLKGDKLFLVTDATPPAGAPVESFHIGGHEVFYREGKCVSAEGTLGGSALTMNEAIANCVSYVGIPLDETIRMATLYPAQALGMDDKLGYLAPGYLADLAIWDEAIAIAGVVDQGRLYGFADHLS
jgi:N-acetylglucosamine-6-phosphate deacetylase